MADELLDVAIVGGGLAGSLLARQLSRAVPGRRIGVFEQRTQYTHQVGESIVELGSHYLVRRLGLSSYLYERHFPKNGLRFFFDSESRDAPLEEMSEIGSASLPFHPAFQVDRSRLEHDLLQACAAEGVAVHRGVEVGSIEVGRGGSRHRLAVSEAGRERTVEARWLVDASGRRRALGRQLGLHADESQLANASAWGWFEGVADIDALGPEAFRRRVRHTARRLSTLHFVHRGYWIWLIPLQNGVTSIGVVCEQPYFEPRFREPAGLLAWLREHAALASLLARAEPIAVRHLDHLAYGTRRFLSADRWALAGEAAAFPDPLYSPGTDFIALENDLIADLVARDLAGASRDALAERAGVYEEFLQFRLEAALRLYRNLYPVLGSYELCKLKWDFDLGCYYALWLAPYMLDRHLDLAYLRRQLRQRPRVLQALSNFAALFRRAEAALTARGEYYRRNRGEYSEGQDALGFLRDLGVRDSERETQERVQAIFNDVRARALDLVEGRTAAVPRAPRPLAWFSAAPSLDAG